MVSIDVGGRGPEITKEEEGGGLTTGTETSGITSEEEVRTVVLEEEMLDHIPERTVDLTIRSKDQFVIRKSG